MYCIGTPERMDVPELGMYVTMEAGQNEASHSELKNYKLQDMWWMDVKLR